MLHALMALLLPFGQPVASQAPAGNEIVWRNVGPGGGGWIEAIACDLPWGVQTGFVQNGEVLAAPQCHLRLLSELRRVLKSGKRIVLLTERRSELEEALRSSALSLVRQWVLSLGGRHPGLYILEKS